MPYTNVDPENLQQQLSTLYQSKLSLLAFATVPLFPKKIIKHQLQENRQITEMTINIMKPGHTIYLIIFHTWLSSVTFWEFQGINHT